MHDTEAKARIHGVSAQMETFNYLYGAILGETILRHTDNLSSTLQHKTLSAAEGQQVAIMTIATLTSLRSDTSFDLFWDIMALKLNVNEPQLPRRRNGHCRIQNCIHNQSAFH